MTPGGASGAQGPGLSLGASRGLHPHKILSFTLRAGSWTESRQPPHPGSPLPRLAQNSGRGGQVTPWLDTQHSGDLRLAPPTPWGGLLAWLCPRGALWSAMCVLAWPSLVALRPMAVLKLSSRHKEVVF